MRIHPSIVGILLIGSTLQGQTTADPFSAVVEAERAAAQAAATETPAPTLTPEAAAMLEKFAAVQKSFEFQKKEIISSAIGRFTTAADSEVAAIQFYLTCQSIMKSRIPDLDGPASQRELKQEAGGMRDAADGLNNMPGTGAMLRLQLQYLIFTLQAPEIKDPSVLVSRMKDMVAAGMGIIKTYSPPVVDDTQRSANRPTNSRPTSASGGSNTKREDPKKQAMKVLNERQRAQLERLGMQGGMNTIFATAYNLRNYVKPLANWPQSPLNVTEVYNQILLPYYRANKKEYLATAWDERIGYEALLNRSKMSDAAYAMWGLNTYKNLVWTKWVDLLKHGNNPALAADELAKHCKENLAHASIGTWMNELNDITTSLRTGTPLDAAEPPMASDDTQHQPRDRSGDQ
jgi:hypothetical protein